MPDIRLPVTLSALLLAVGASAASAATPSNERRINGWQPMAIALGGDHVVYARSSANTIRIGAPYTVFRTDTFKIRLAGNRLASRPIPGVILRTSAGPTTGGLLAANSGGHHVLAATGRNFRPMVTWCCTNNDHDTPVQTDGRRTAPVTLAVGLNGMVVNLLMRNNAGEMRLVRQQMSSDSMHPLGHRAETSVDVVPASTAQVAITRNTVVWVDARDRNIHVASVTEDGTLQRVATMPNPGPGPIVRLAASEHAVAIVVRDVSPGRFQVIRFDTPAWQPLTVWRGTTAPPIALGDRTLAVAAGRSLLQHTPGGPLLRRAVLRSSAFGLASDGRRIGVIERITIRQKPLRRKPRPPLRQTAIRIVNVANPPAPLRTETTR